MVRFLFRIVTHGIALAIGFALGVYLLPILTAPPSPDRAMLQEMAQDAEFTAEFTRDLKGSDFLHWGEGKISLGADRIVHEGKLAPGPDYKLYLVPEFVEDEAEFAPLKSASVIVGDVKTFDGLILDVPAGIDITAYTTVLIWCEAFGEFITAAKYR
ncbi:DM13 domain-containing protein [Pseudaestuariivita atlantica]|uniref:Phenylalanine--tRNA ligase n=1 Tax=Pseudaestuariivita atlantica TaxID=1317121 RepID=A0A0L1JNS3_9RHOB|nr:DM13 domain-containing protein [Pseudaestuariivita atlantica]KNG93409.1 phenylalanine--tRNA ligase [Pseudaestuariivita atlantica]